MRGEQRNVFATGAERRQLQGDDIEAIEKIFAEFALADRLPQIDVGGGDDAHIHLDLLDAAHVHEAAVLQHAQYFRLRLHAHGADLVEKKGAGIGHLEEALFRGHRGGERSLDMAEEGGLQQVGGHGTGVDGHEWPVFAGRI